MNRPFLNSSAIAAVFVFCIGSTAHVRADDDAPAAPTFYKNIAPIFQQHCQDCHHAGTSAPMALMTYEDARPWVKSIRKAVGDGSMPPWHADPAHGHFKNDRSLSAADKATLLDWAAAGAPAGDPKDGPAPLVFAEGGWMIGEPDAILALPEHTVAAEKEDEFITLNAPVDFKEERWVKAVEFKPGNPAVVHHIVTTELGTYSPGRQPFRFDDGLAFLIKPGEPLRVQMHYHKAAGQAATDATKIGLKFATGDVHKQVRIDGAFNPRIEIPPGEAKHELQATYKFARDSHLISMKPHMHLRGKSMTYTAVFPDGREEMLLSVPNFNYEWQEDYALAEPLAAPKGTEIRVWAAYDNSAANPHNPDPGAMVRNGQLTTDEMMIGWVTFTDDEEDVAAGKLVKAGRWGGRSRDKAEESGLTE